MTVATESSFFDLSTAIPATSATSEMVASDSASARERSLVDELLRIRSSQTVWDGSECEAPSPETVDAAIRWVQTFNANAGDLPDQVVPGVSGDIVFYWRRPGYMIEAIYLANRHIEWMEKRGDEFKHFETDDRTVICIE